MEWKKVVYFQEETAVSSLVFLQRDKIALGLNFPLLLL